jgi:hypothetical protein
MLCLDAPIGNLGTLTGITINTVARRVTLHSNVTVLETLRQIQLDQIEISKHENISLADLLSEGIPVSGLFKSILNFRNFVVGQTTIANDSTEHDLFRYQRSGSIDGCAYSLFCRATLLLTRSCQYRLSFCKLRPPPVSSLALTYMQGIDVIPHSINGFSISIIYSNEAITEPEVNVILDHLEAALLFLVNHPHDNVCDVNLMNEPEWQRLVGDIPLGNRLSSAQNMSELIEAQVARTPEKIAVCVILTCLAKSLFMAYVAAIGSRRILDLPTNGSSVKRSCPYVNHERRGARYTRCSLHGQIDRDVLVDSGHTQGWWRLCSAGHRIPYRTHSDHCPSRTDGGGPNDSRVSWPALFSPS